MSKISPEHLARGAFVYVRQSTADQLRNNHESRRRQYALAERAQMLGWSEVVVIDDDLGVSAGGVARPGFERLLAAICAGQVGAVVSIEASRLARNGRDWHTLLEFCALVGSVIVDEDGVYDPRSVNDRLLLGMKGTMSEMELSLLRQRSAEALKLKAARGELHTTVAIGFVRSADDRIELDPDQRIREAIGAVFARFAQAGSVRQVLLWFRQERIELPSALYVAGRRSVVWRLPSYNTVLHILANPVYAGAYAFGRTESRVRIEAGRKRVGRGYRRQREDWQVLILDHHDGYIDWDTYEHNQNVIADNTNMRGAMARGALRRGEALLAGLLRCGHCGRKLHVAYSGSDGHTSRYHCKGAAINHGSPHKCISFGPCAWIRRSRGKCWPHCVRSGWRLHCMPLSNAPPTTKPGAGNSYSHSSKRVSRRYAPNVNSMPWTPPTGLSPRSSSDAGTSAWPSSRSVRRRSTRWTSRQARA
jgi:DNA invertase Pin-like site-specific DNA recombinase